MPIFRGDRALLEGFRKGAPEALTTVYSEYVGKVERLLRVGFEVRGCGLRVAGAFQHPSDLADLVQEVFVRAFSKKGRLGFDGLREYGPYILAIARNLLVDWARARGREIPLAGTELEAVTVEIAILEETPPWANPATMRTVEDYLKALPADLRDVHRLRYEQGLSQVQAAENLGIGRQTLRTLEARLRDGLSAALDAAGLGSRPTPVRLEAEVGGGKWAP